MNPLAAISARLRRPPTTAAPDAQRYKPAVSPQLAGVAPGELRMPEAFAALDAPPLFITGVARSGTSMAFDLFTRHPEVFAVFESWLLTQRTGVTGVFHQLQWRDDFYEYQQERVGQPHAAVQLLSYAAVANELGELLAGWLTRSMPADRRYYVEKTPLDVGALPALFPGARVAHVIRDGRDVVGSVRRARATWAPRMGGRDPATFWGRRVSEIRAHRAELGDRYMEFRFESLREDMARETRRMFDFAGIPVDDQLLPTLLAATDASEYTPESRQSGFRGEGRVGGWRSWMTRAEGKAFDAVAGEQLVELGYAENRDWWRALPRRAREQGA